MFFGSEKTHFATIILVQDLQKFKRLHKLCESQFIVTSLVQVHTVVPPGWLQAGLPELLPVAGGLVLAAHAGGQPGRGLQVRAAGERLPPPLTRRHQAL